MAWNKEQGHKKDGNTMCCNRMAGGRVKRKQHVAHQKT
jgi:hypothetical protein